MTHADVIFEELRPELSRLAYHMVGSLSDADDVLQESFLRWFRTDQSRVKSPRAYLHSIVVSLCIDQHRAINVRKERYIGPWLPEPVVEFGDRSEFVESVSMALLVVLETLTHAERASYILRRVFDYEYSEIAEILGKSEAASRRLVSRAEERVHARRLRFDVAPGEIERITERFMTACNTGDVDTLRELFAEDAVVYSDGGGHVAAALVPIHGAERLARFFVGISRKAPSGLNFQHVYVNGQRGLVTRDEGQVSNVLSFDVIDGKVANCYIIRNPEKLARVSAGEQKPA